MTAMREIQKKNHNNIIGIKIKYVCFVSEITEMEMEFLHPIREPQKLTNLENNPNNNKEK